MATLQRSAVSFRRQGSSGLVWDEKYCLAEDGKVEYRELRPCQSARGAIGMVEEEDGDSDIAAASTGPVSFPRSLSAPGKNMIPAEIPGNEAPGVFRKVLGIPKPKSGKRKP